MRLASPAFANSPPLQWSGAPPETRSFVLLCDDPDAPAGVWRHWAVYDIPSATSELGENLGAAGVGRRLKQGTNDFHRPGYGGPVRFAGTASTTITFGCWLYRGANSACAMARLARKRSRRRESVRSPKRR